MGEESGGDGVGKGAVCCWVFHRGEFFGEVVGVLSRVYDSDTLPRISPNSDPQVGIGTPASPQTSIQWYKLAAENGDKRAEKRLKNIGSTLTRAGTGKQVLEAARQEEREAGGKDGCLVM
jgi:hypothetical protein